MAKYEELIVGRLVVQKDVVMPSGAVGASVPEGGTGAVTLTDHGVLLGSGTGAITPTAVMTNGQLLVGQTGADPLPKTVSGDATLAETGALTIGAKKVLASMTAIADGKILIGGAAGAGAEQTLTGDVTVTNAGVTAIGSAKVTNAMLASGAGVGALLTAGLGGSVSVTKTSAATTTVVAANATKDRACLVLVVVDEAYAIGTGTLPTVKIGEDDTVEKCMAATVLTDEAAGTVLAFAFTNLATKKIIVTTTAAVGNSTGGCSITVLAIPTT